MSLTFAAPAMRQMETTRRIAENTANTVARVLISEKEIPHHSNVSKC
jgi:hypothetical protein